MQSAEMIRFGWELIITRWVALSTLYERKVRMIISKEQSKEMLEASKPLIKWMNDNCHPYCECLVDCASIRLVEGVTIQKTEEFLKD
jgi:hypothetical protein